MTFAAYGAGFHDCHCFRTILALKTDSQPMCSCPISVTSRAFCIKERKAPAYATSATATPIPDEQPEGFEPSPILSRSAFPYLVSILYQSFGKKSIGKMYKNLKNFLLIMYNVPNSVRVPAHAPPKRKEGCRSTSLLLAYKF